MIKKYETQDQYGNKIYRYTSSDIVLDTDTGHTVKQDLDTIMSALGMSDSASTGDKISLDAATLEGHPSDDFVLFNTFDKSLATVTEELAKLAPIDSATLTGEPTAPVIEELGNNSERIANTKYVDDTAADLLEKVNASLEELSSKTHTHSASDILSGEFAVTNVRAKDGTDYTASRIRNIAFIGDSEDLPTTLENGSILFTYEG